MNPIVVTGTDTHVGKTVATVLLTRFWRAQGRAVRAVKPFCSGGRDDAEALWEAQGREVPLDTINPWHFPEPLTPLLAARQAGQTLELSATLTYLRAAAREADPLVIEGAGGLLSPLGEDFSARELIRRLRAVPVVVCPNRLGAINQVRLVLAALDTRASELAQVVLMEQAEPDDSAPGNIALLQELVGAGRIHPLPWLKQSALRCRLPAALARIAARIQDITVAAH